MAAPIEGPGSLTPEWFAYREKTIGASEAAKACGLSEYGTPLSLYLEKTGQVPPFAGNEHTRRGRRYEPLIAEDWEELRGIKLRRYPCPMFIHGLYDFISATPDGEIDDTSGLEIKSSTWRAKSKLGDEGTDDIPSEWFIQAQQQMLVMNWSRVEFCILIELEPHIHVVERNDALISLMIDAERELIERIRDRRPPEPNWNHASTPSLIRELHQTANDCRIVLNGTECELWAEYELVGKAIKKLDDYRDKCKAAVLHAIGDNYAGILDDGRMIRRKLIEKKPYTVDPKPYWDARCVKSDGGRLIERESPSLETYPELKRIGEVTI